LGGNHRSSPSYVCYNSARRKYRSAIVSGFIKFKAHLLAIRLRGASSQADAPAAIGALERMLGDRPTDHERAAIFYELWRLDAIK
jgi:hypothetical protein